jgi:SAM-dependent methyltransferase
MVPCPICGSDTSELGAVDGKFLVRRFLLRRCPSCRFSFVADPATDFAQIYTRDYYAGKGADPLVDYIEEMEHFSTTVRHYEWRGILTAVQSLVPVSGETRWLDFGCGTGGLIRYCRGQSDCRPVGYEDGEARSLLRDYGIPTIEPEELDASQQSFDVVTAIEVLEHLTNPLAALERIRRLLRPGGLLFYTTGNAQPFRDRLLEWRYVIPEIHVSFFEPETLVIALEKTGFRPQLAGFLPGYEDIVRFKVLKNLRFSRRSLPERTVPWRLVSRIVERRYRAMAHPIGWAV